MSKTYCIFKVYDYKGGELSSRVNLSHEDFIGELAEKFENAAWELKEDKATRRDTKIDTIVDSVKTDEYKIALKSAILAEINDSDFYSTYAGGDGFVGEMYCIENNIMKSVSHSQFVDEIVDYIDKNWND